jgi:hypothetical protein
MDRSICFEIGFEARGSKIIVIFQANHPDHPDYYNFILLLFIKSK